MYFFGSGVMTVTPSGSNQTPVNVGLLQEGSIDVAQTTKALYGQYRDPLAIGAGTRKWTGKAKVARISGRALNAILLGGTLATGYTNTAVAEAGTVPGSSSYTVTVTNSATWLQDQGVVYTTTGLPLVRVASGPTVGQYSVSSGVYTFASADANAKVLISYNYTVSGNGQSIVVPQTLIGPTTTFGVNMSGVDPTNSAVWTGRLYNCVASKFALSSKLEDFTMPEFDFEAYANAAGSVGDFNFPDTF